MTSREPSSEELLASGLRPPPDAVIAIDGPAGSGKSTTARAVARAWQLTYIDTGAMYRALTLAALETGIGPADGAALATLLADADLDLRPCDGETVVHWHGRDVSREIRTPAVDAAVSAVSAHGEVRRQMVERQRALGRRGGVVMEGRDIGSVVFPLATTKIYLDASLDARAARRHRQFAERGEAADLARVRDDLAERDRQDSTRADSPLTISPDAIVLDTSDLTLAAQIDAATRACLVNVWLDDQDRPLTVRAATWRATPFRYRLAYSFMILVANACRLRVFGLATDRVPPPGVILASNHVTQWDPPIVGSTFRRARVCAMAKAELFAVEPAGAFLRWIDVIPVRRAGFDRAAFAAAAAALKRGDCVFLFPEGTRRPAGTPGPILAGLGMLVCESGADIVPIFVRGTGSLRPGGRPDAPLEVRYGPRLRLHALPLLLQRCERREVIRRVNDLFLAAVRELQARSYLAQPLTARERQVAETQQERDRQRQRPFRPAS